MENIIRESGFTDVRMSLIPGADVNRVVQQLERSIKDYKSGNCLDYVGSIETFFESNVSYKKEVEGD